RRLTPPLPPPPEPAPAPTDPLRLEQEPAPAERHGLVKVEKQDSVAAEETGLQAAFGQSGSYGAEPFDAADSTDHEVAGFLSRVADQQGGGGGDALQAPGPSEDSSLQGRVVFRVCPRCQQPLYSAAAFSQHMDLHAGRTRCRHCSRVLSSRQRLQTHLERVHGINASDRAAGRVGRPTLPPAAGYAPILGPGHIPRPNV
ncbi:zinc finger protein 526-like, partial [Pollicipes pollicipes]|uniref:zinc finger protein 526-like n=1 Tax=Pollicipes pollicipes TaxID=41117 RepID=UPI001884F516